VAHDIMRRPAENRALRRDAIVVPEGLMTAPSPKGRKA
jgi:hypothetical protein